MKKFLAVYVGLALALLIGINVVNATDIFGMTDEEIMNEFIDEEYGEEYEGVLEPEMAYDDKIGFRVCLNGVTKVFCSIDRTYYEGRYND